MMNETIELSAWVWVPLLVLTWVWGVGMMAGDGWGGVRKSCLLSV